MTSQTRTRNFLSLAILFLIFMNVEAQEPDLHGPANVSALVNTETQLNCTWLTYPGTENVLQWAYLDTSGSFPIYQSRSSSISYPTEYNVSRNNDTKEFNLILKSVSFELASSRLHTCSMLFLPITQYSAIVVAVDYVQCPAPGIIEAVEGSEVQVECSVRYASYQDRIQPMLDWTKSAIENDTAMIMPSHYQTNATHAWSYMNLTLDSTYDEVNFTCDLSYIGGDPAYTDSCTTFLYVLYGVKEVSFDPVITDGQELTTGTVITCIAKGRPAPSFEWHFEDNSTVISGAELEVTEDMVGKDLVMYTCYATNNIDGVNYTATRTLSFTAVAAPTGEVGTNSVETWVIVVSVVVPVCVIIIVAVIVFIIVRRRRQNRKSRRQTGGSTAAASTIPMSVTATTTQQNANSSEDRPFLYSASTDPPVPVAAPRPLSAGSNGVPAGMGFADLGGGAQSPNQPSVNGVNGRGPGSLYGGSLSRVNTPNPVSTYPYQPAGRLTPASAYGAGGRGTPGAMMAGPPSVAAYGATPAGGASRAGSTGRLTPGSVGPGVDMRQNPSAGSGYPYQQRPPSVGSASTMSHSGSSYHGSQHSGLPPALSLPPQRDRDAASHTGSLV